MADSGARRGDSAKLSLPLMIVSFLAIGGFLYWLNVSSSAYVAAFAAEEEVVEEDPDADASTVALSDLQVNPEGWVGQSIRLEDIPVLSQVGPRAFWTEFPNQTPFLIRVTQDGVLVESGWSADVVGSVHAMSDSVLDAWDAEGVFTDPNQRLEAEFAEVYFEARRVDLDRGDGNDNDTDGGGGAD